MADRELFYLTHAGLTAWRWHDAAVHELARFTDGEAGIDAFSAHLAQHPQARCTLVADLADEAFHLETLPLLRGRDRRQLIARRQAQLHLDTPYVAHQSLGRDSGNPRSERLLIAALTRPPALRPWLAAIAQASTVLTGIHSTALLSMAVQRQLRPRPPRALLVHTTPAGLRISCFEHDLLRFSRLVPSLSPSTVGFWQSCRDEILRTSQYLIGQRALERGGATPVQVLAHPDQHAILRAACPDSPDLRFIPLDLPELARRCGLRSPPDSSDSLPLLLHLAVRARRQPQFAPPDTLQQQRLSRVGTAIGVFTASLLSASLIVTTKNLVETARLREQAAALHSASLAEERLATDLAAATPTLPVPRNTLQADIAKLAALQRFTAGPKPFFKQLAAILDTQPDIELLQLDWSAPRTPADAQAQDIRLEVNLPTSSEHAASHFLNALRQLPGAAIDIDPAPDKLDDHTALHARTPAAIPRLIVRATLPPAAP